MAYELRDGQGSLFKNNKREKDSHPQARGQAKIVCPHCQKSFMAWLSAWTKKTRDGEPWQSLAIEAQDAKPERDNSRMSRQTEERYPDDDLDGAPF